MEERMEERELTFPDWQLQYYDALSESEPETRRGRVAEAERAILARLAELFTVPGSEIEQSAIREALDCLYVLKIRMRGFPNWGGGRLVH